MRTKLYGLVTLLLTLLLSSCFDDKTNMNILDNEVITIENIEERYERLTSIDRLVIDPEVTSSRNDAEFSYKWGIYEDYSSGIESIAETKNLNYLVNKSAKKWTLVFFATNVKTGFTEMIESRLDVVTPFSRGWYVLKDDGTSSDIDIFMTPNTIQPDPKPIENLMMSLNKRNLVGKGVKMSVMDYYLPDPITNRFVNKKALFLMSEEDLFGVSVSDLSIGLDKTSITFMPLSPCKPSGIFPIGNGEFFLINNNKLHARPNGPSTSPLFGIEKAYDSENRDYELSKFLTIGLVGVYFDNKNSSFVGAGSNNTVLTIATDGENTQLTAIENHQRCLYFGAKNNIMTKAIVLFEDKRTGVRSIYDLTLPLWDMTISMTKRRELSRDDKANSATLFTTSRIADVLYFFVDGKIWSYNVANGTEKVEYVLPDGEEVVFIREHDFMTTKELEQYRYKGVILGSNKGGRYCVRLFDTSAGNFTSTSPSVEFSGNGNCRDVVYISPLENTPKYPYY